MKDFIKEHKKICILAGTAFAVLFIIYLFALFRPGYWYRDVFLYKQKAPFEGMKVYSGHDAVNSADYELVMAKDGMTTYMAFTVNETEKAYEIISDDSEEYYPAVTIFENEEQVFSGTYTGFYLRDENGEPFEPLISIGYGPYTPTEEELFPSYNWLYSVSQSEKTEIRGQPLWLICIVIFIGMVAIDMFHPDLFWELEHRIDVTGGEPSEYYRTVQKGFWIASPFVVILLMIFSFAIKI